MSGQYGCELLSAEERMQIMKKRNRKNISRLLCGCLIISLLSGCGRQGKIEENVGQVVSENGKESKETLSDNGAAKASLSGNEMLPANETEEKLVSFRDVYGVTYQVSFNELADVHDYDMSCIIDDGQFKSYEAPGYTSRMGIDVSKFQGDIDWQAVKEQGISYAFIRVGNRGYGKEGTLNTDGKYLQNIEGAKAAGIDVGVYFYSQAISEEEALEEAEYVIKLLEGIELDYPVVYDAEYVIEDEARTDGVGAEQFTENTIVFCQRIEEAGYKPIIYATMKWEAYALELHRVNAYEKWYADYEELPQTPYDFTYWQYTNEGTLEGIEGPVDLNLEIIPIEERTEEILAGMSQEEKVAQLFFVTPDALTGNAGLKEGGEALKQALKDYPVGGIVYFSGNIETPEQTKALLKETRLDSKAAAVLPAFLAVDEEGGSVARVAGNPAMGIENVGDMAAVGATGNERNAYEAGKTIGGYLSDLGFNMDFAPDADVLTNPENTVVKKRSFGTEPELVSRMALAYMNGLSEENVAGCLKHYPGHGATAADTHEGYAYIEKGLEELKNSDLIPFIRGIEEGVPVIMAGHISLPDVTGDDMPASLSEKMIADILRTDLGYDGLVITDALNMGAVTQQYTSEEACILALEAGADMLLMPEDFKSAYNGVLEAVSEGRISEEALDEAVKRIIRVKLQYL